MAFELAIRGTRRCAWNRRPLISQAVLLKELDDIDPFSAELNPEPRFKQFTSDA
jgi:hypothetical protein